MRPIDFFFYLGTVSHLEVLNRNVLYHETKDIQSLNQEQFRYISFNVKIVVFCKNLQIQWQNYSTWCKKLLRQRYTQVNVNFLTTPFNCPMSHFELFHWPTVFGTLSLVIKSTLYLNVANQV